MYKYLSKSESHIGLLYFQRVDTAAAAGWLKRIVDSMRKRYKKLLSETKMAVQQYGEANSGLVGLKNLLVDSLGRSATIKEST